MENQATIFVSKLQQMVDCWHEGEINQAQSLYEDLLAISESTGTDFNRNLNTALTKLRQRCVGVLDSKKN